jgi:hypothetical protein
MAATKYFVRSNNDTIVVSVPVVNTSTSYSNEVSVVFAAFTGLTLVTAESRVGTFTTLTRTWDGFTLKPKETQTLILTFTIPNVDRTSLNNRYLSITGTITNAVDGNDATGTAIDIKIYKQEDLDKSINYKLLLNQAGTAAPTAVFLNNEATATPTLARTGVGVYTITLTGGFADTIFPIITPVGLPTAVFYNIVRTSNNVLTLTTYDISRVAADLVGDLAISIDVYYLA